MFSIEKKITGKQTKHKSKFKHIPCEIIGSCERYQNPKMQPLKVFPCASMFMIILALLAHSAYGRSPTETKTVLYFHEFAAGPNATMVPIAGIARELWTFSQF